LIDGGHATVQVHHEHCLSTRRDQSLQASGVESVRVGVNVTEHRPRPGGDDGGDRWDPGIRRYDHLSARLDAYGLQRNADGVRAGLDTDALEVRAVIGGKGLLEGCALRPENEPASIEDAANGRVKLAADFADGQP
jgi:hypothetical protein